VTVGTHNKGFERLVHAADKLAAETQEPIVIQYGSSQYVPKHADSFRWASSQEMERLTRLARVVVTHAAAGSMISALLNQKPLVITPRSSIHGESIDDHQIQLAKVISLQEMAIYVKNPTPNALKLAISKCAELKTLSSSDQQLIVYLKGQLNDWDQTTRPWFHCVFRKT
jgi:UDP-N-acetylglucosamine transferase subunit ALG13